MKRRTVKVIIVALCLSLTTIGIALAQPDSPLVGIPHMSDQPDGAEVREFPAGIDTIYLVFDYETDGPVEIIAEIRSEEQQGAVIFNGQETYSGTGTANVEIPGPGSASFPDGVYDTIIRFGDQRYITAGWEWVVGDVPLPAEDTSGGQAPISPLEQGEAGSESTAGSSVSTSPDPGRRPKHRTCSDDARPIPSHPDWSRCRRAPSAQHHCLGSAWLHDSGKLIKPGVVCV